MPRDTKLIIGLGVTGKSCVDFFTREKIKFKIFDTRKTDPDTENFILKIDSDIIRFSDYKDDFLDDIDEVVVSPGLDLDHKIFDYIKKNHIPMTTDIDIFKKYCSTPCISVTGTNGKTTVVTMLEFLLTKSSVKAIACGNNGIPPLSILTNNYDYIILELSSYQLEYMNNQRTFISILTNVADDHLERHETYDKYLSIKKKIFSDSQHKFCNLKIFNELNLDHKDIIGFEYNSGKGEFIINDRAIESQYFLNYKFNGAHNYSNCLAALSVCDVIGLDRLRSIEIMSEFKYLPHRIELVKNSNDIKWFNDSKSTNVSSTIAALEYVNNNIILIMGGANKNLDYSKLSPYIDAHAKLVILLGENSSSLADQISSQIDIKRVQTMTEAIQLASENAIALDSVLLSPASPSFDMYKNFEERGIAFRQAVKELVK